MFESIIDQEIPVQILKTILKNGHIPNALLLTGIEGTGKKKTAVLFAMAANCSGDNAPCSTCSSCAKILSGNHPDILRISPQGNMIKVAQIRELIKTLHRRPFEAKKRVVIIEDAHLINKEAGNSLLKILEEPPHSTHFILTSSNTENLLPTILSRSQEVRFSPVSPGQIRSHLTDRFDIDDQTAQLISEMAEGSISRAESMADTSEKGSRFLEVRNRITEKMSHIEKLPATARLSFAASLSRKKDQISEYLHIMRTYLRDILVSTYAPEKIIYKDLSGMISEDSRKNTTESILKRIEAIDEAQKHIQANANPRLTLEILMIRMSRV